MNVNGGEGGGVRTLCLTSPAVLVCSEAGFQEVLYDWAFNDAPCAS